MAHPAAARGSDAPRYRVRAAAFELSGSLLPILSPTARYLDEARIAERCHPRGRNVPVVARTLVIVNWYAAP